MDAKTFKQFQRRQPTLASDLDRIMSPKAKPTRVRVKDPAIAAALISIMEGLTPFQRRVKVGGKVWWEDPDGGRGSGYYQVKADNSEHGAPADEEDIFSLVGASANYVEVFRSELHEHKRAPTNLLRQHHAVVDLQRVAT